MKEYIYREAVISALAEHLGDISARAALAAECVINKIPAATVREVVPGRWNEESPDYLDGDSIYVCSACGETWNLEADTPKENNMNFCPNCGADMRESLERVVNRLKTMEEKTKEGTDNEQSGGET